jgi:hypothetical protein
MEKEKENLIKNYYTKSNLNIKEFKTFFEMGFSSHIEKIYNILTNDPIFQFFII